MTGVQTCALPIFVWNHWKGNEGKLSTSVPATLPAVSKSITANQPQIHSVEEAIPGRPNPKTVLPAPALNSVNGIVQAHHPHTNLEVLVKRAKSGEVIVRVLGPDGTQAAMLYQGMLRPGNWTFDWNGRLGDGGPPPAGTYQIQVVSGAVTLNKSVVIRK